MRFKLFEKKVRYSFIKFEDYLQQCLINTEFKKEWENLDTTEELDENNITHDFPVLYESDLTLKNLIKNKGVPKTIEVKTEIVFFELADGTCPVIDFLNEIENEKLKAKTVRSIYNLAILGDDLNKTKSSSYVADGIYELRTKQGSNIDRIFYFFMKGNKIILTNGYIKKSKKMDPDEFEKAKKYRDICSK